MLEHARQHPIAQTLRIVGPLDTARLEEALQSVFDRHEALRARPGMVDGQLRMLIGGPARASLRVERLEPFHVDTTRRSRANELQRSFIQAGSDLGRFPLLHAQLIRFDEHRHELTIVAHPVIADRESLDIVAHEIGEFYSAAIESRGVELPALTASYAEFARDRLERFDAPATRAAIARWRERLGALEPLELVAGRPAARTACVSDRVGWRIDRATTETLEALARAEDTDLYTVVLACFQTLLMRHAGCGEVAVGTGVANRTQVGGQALVGSFTNNLVMHADLSGDPDFRSLLRRVREGVDEAMRDRDLPFERMLAELAPARDSGAHPLMPVGFELRDPGPGMRLAGTERIGLRLDPSISRYELSLEVTRTGEGLDAVLVFDAELFERGRIERMARHMQRLLVEAAANPDRGIGDLPMLGEDELRRVRLTGRQTPMPPSPLATIVTEFEAQAARRPEAPALVQGERRLSYRELDEAANELAGRLRALGVGADERVALCVDRSPEAIVAMLAILKAGGAYLPIDGALPDARRNTVLEDSTPKAVVAHRSHLDGLGVPAGAGLVVLDPEPDPAKREEPASTAGSHPQEAIGTPGEPAAGPSSLAYVLYTSGSTGRPKGVMIEHRNLLNHACWFAAEFGLSHADVSLQRTTLAFDAAGVEIWPTLIVGATLVIADEDQARDPGALLELIRTEGITVMQAVPGQIGALLDELERHPSGRSPSLRGVFVGGDVLSPQDARQWYRHTGIALVNMYGPTECTIDATFHRWAPDADDGPVPIGRPVGNCSIRILDAQLRPVPLGAPGEICIGGDGVARGYLGRPELDADRFVADPDAASPGARLYRSGDLGRLRADGAVEYIGRIDRQVKVRGFRIELGDIEAALLSCGARSAATVVISDSIGMSRVAACVTPGDIDLAQLRSRLAARLPGYMIPALIHRLDDLPVTPSGKLDRQAILATLKTATALHTRGGSTTPPESEPIGETDEKILALWRRLLDQPMLQVDDNFFDAGGHSLLALRMLGQVEREFGRMLRVAALLGAPTVREFSRLLRDDEPADHVGCAVTIQTGGPAAPLFFVSGYGGEIVMFRDLARELGQAQPLVVLDTTAFTAEEIAGLTLPDIATRMIIDMRRIQPHGPYHLSGFSLGGKYVYEMARQLRAAGESVALLALLDCDAPGYPPRRPMPQRIAMHLRRMLGQGLEANGRYVRDRLRWLASRFRQRDLFENARELAETDVAQAMSATAEAMLALWEAHEDPGSYDGDLLVIRARRPFRPSVIDDDPQLGWSSLVSGTIQVRDQDANHMDMLRPEHVRDLADILLDFLGTPPDDPMQRGRHEASAVAAIQGESPQAAA
jgi:amino acid adenylation domain-containing protein